LPVADSVTVEPCKPNREIEGLLVGFKRINRLTGEEVSPAPPYVRSPTCTPLALSVVTGRAPNSTGRCRLLPAPAACFVG
jgi:hypothetical protein